MATLQGLKRRMSNLKQFKTAEEAVEFIEGKEKAGFRKTYEEEWKTDAGRKVCHVRLERQGFRVIDLMVVEGTSSEEVKAA